jgi:hypothetical protein
MVLIKKKSYLARTTRKFKDDIMKRKGRFGEVAFVSSMSAKGKPVKRTGVGSDYRRGNKLYEIKTGKAQQTKRQKATMKKNPGRYKVVRYGLGSPI